MSTNTTAVLNDLIETLKDGQEGFKSAAEGVSAESLRSVFTEYSNQRAQYAGQLQELARSLGDSSPTDSSSVTSSIHRGWINIKSALTGKNDHSVLEEAERGEDIAVAAYKEALTAELPANVRAVVQEQADGVQAAHNRVRDLRDGLAK